MHPLSPHGLREGVDLFIGSLAVGLGIAAAALIALTLVLIVTNGGADKDGDR